MAASRMCHGVTKPGSPIPSETTLSIDCTMSKKSRIPERGIPRTCSATKSRFVVGFGFDTVDILPAVGIKKRKTLTKTMVLKHFSGFCWEKADESQLIEDQSFTGLYGDTPLLFSSGSSFPGRIVWTRRAQIAITWRR